MGNIGYGLDFVEIIYVPKMAHTSFELEILPRTEKFCRF